MSESDRTALPREVLARYNAAYNNDSYLAFKSALTALLDARRMDGAAEYEYTVMNLLIEASFERSGGELYRGAELSLVRMLRLMGERLIPLALAHLAHFGTADRRAGMEAPTDWVLWTLSRAQECAEDGAAETSDVGSWRGRAAYFYASAAALLLHTSQAVLVESHYDSYPLEKLDRAMQHLAYAAREMKAHGMGISDDYMDWLAALVKARG
jgi:hypothetical protein